MLTCGCEADAGGPPMTRVGLGAIGAAGGGGGEEGGVPARRRRRQKEKVRQLQRHRRGNRSDGGVDGGELDEGR